MNAADLVLLLVLAAAAVVGFFQGVIRSLLAIGAWAVSFVLAANLRDPVGRYLASQWTTLSADYVYMLAFGAVALVLLVVLLGAIRVGTRGPKGVTSVPLLDDVLAGALGVLFAALVIGATSVILATFHGPRAVAGTDPEAEWSAQLYAVLQDSSVGRTVIGLVTPVMDVLLGPLTPQVVRDGIG